MSIVKNSYGVSIVISPFQSNYNKMGSLSGSCLDRLKTINPVKKKPDKDSEKEKNSLDLQGKEVSKKL